MWNGESNYSADRHSYVSTAEVHKLVERDSRLVTSVKSRKEPPVSRPNLKKKRNMIQDGTRTIPAPVLVAGSKDGL